MELTCESRSARRVRFACFAPALLAGSLLVAAPINLNTGVASWTGSGPNVVGTVAAVNLGATPNSVWLTAPGGSQWVSTQATDGVLPPASTGLPGTYTFIFSFATPGLGGSLSFGTAADNQVSVAVKLDGVTISTYSHPGNSLINTNLSTGCAFLPAGNTTCTPDPAQGLVGPGTINWSAGGIGLISIEATVTNGLPPNPSPVGFLLNGTATPTPPDVLIPEPATFAMVGLGGLGLIAFRQRR